jgi:antitoxin component YwqK of YwqJK toxin-antitoxin module
MHFGKRFQIYYLITGMKTDKIKNGKWKEFNKHAILIAEGVYVNDKKHGTWREYYDDTGSIVVEEDYWHGIQHGRYRSFYPNGQIFSEGLFVNGLREGYFKVYDEHGHNIKNLLFDNNQNVEDTTICLMPANSEQVGATD